MKQIEEATLAMEVRVVMPTVENPERMVQTGIPHLVIPGMNPLARIPPVIPEVVLPAIYPVNVIPAVGLEGENSVARLPDRVVLTGSPDLGIPGMNPLAVLPAVIPEVGLPIIGHVAMIPAGGKEVSKPVARVRGAHPGQGLSRSHLLQMMPHLERLKKCAH